jgi:hypothetical protein
MGGGFVLLIFSLLYDSLAPVLGPVLVLSHWTGPKLLPACYANFGFMRHKLKLGELATERREVETPVWFRIAAPAKSIPIWCEREPMNPKARATRSDGTRRDRHFARETERSKFTNHQSLPTNHKEFLIDTLPIRIASNSFVCFIGSQSNRHSSEPSKLRQNSASQLPSNARKPLCIAQFSMYSGRP